MDYSVIRIKPDSLKFEEVSEKRAIGGLKDFFAQKGDVEYNESKKELLLNIDSIFRELMDQSFSQIGYVRVILREEAIAKSYRPVKKLFRTSLTPLVGGDGIGEMIFEVQPNTLRSVVEEMKVVEHSPKQIPRKNGKIKAIPTRLRCEIGAIEKIELWGVDDRLKFNAAVAIKSLSHPTTGGGYYVELFRELKSESEWSSLSEPYLTLHKSFIEGLQNLKQSIDAFVIPQQVRKNFTETNQSKYEIFNKFQQESLTLFLRLNKSGTDNYFRLIDISNRDHYPDSTEWANSQIELNVFEHEKLLNFLSKHELVRRIDLPGIWMESDNHSSKSGGRRKPFKIGSPTKKLENYPLIGVIDGGISKKMKSWVIYETKFIKSSNLNKRHGTYIAGLLIDGKCLNGYDNCPEDNGVAIFDIAILPDKNRRPFLKNKYYKNSKHLTYPDPIVSKIDEEISKITENYNLRIINFSIGLNQTNIHSYSIMALYFDEMSEKHKIFFVISAGNLTKENSRLELPKCEVITHPPFEGVELNSYAT